MNGNPWASCAKDIHDMPDSCKLNTNRVYSSVCGKGCPIRSNDCYECIENIGNQYIIGLMKGLSNEE